MNTHDEVYRAQEHNNKYLDAQRMRQAIGKADTVTVEFGTANTPLYLSSPINFDDKNVYVGVNIDPAQHEFLRRDVERVKGYATVAKIDTTGSVETLLPEESTDTVFMANVFGEPDDKYIGLRDTFPDDDEKYAGNSSLETKLNTLQEARRVLKPDGKIIIVETNTPYIGDTYAPKPNALHEMMTQIKSQGYYDGSRTAPKPFEGMITQLESNGFQVIDAVCQTDDDWAEISSHYANPQEWWSHQSYLVIASKV